MTVILQDVFVYKQTLNLSKVVYPSKWLTVLLICKRFVTLVMVVCYQKFQSHPTVVLHGVMIWIVPVRSVI